MIESSYRSWDLYTTGELVDGLQQKKKTGFDLTEMESCLFEGDNFIVPPCNITYVSVGVSPLQMDSSSCDIYRLSSLLRSLGAVHQERTLIFMIVLSWGGVSPSYRLCMDYILSVYFL